MERFIVEIAGDSSSLSPDVCICFSGDFSSNRIFRSNTATSDLSCFNSSSFFHVPPTISRSMGKSFSNLVFSVLYCSICFGIPCPNGAFSCLSTKRKKVLQNIHFTGLSFIFFRHLSLASAERQGTINFHLPYSLSASYQKTLLL